MPSPERTQRRAPAAAKRAPKVAQPHDRLIKTAKKRRKVMKDALDELREEGRVEGGAKILLEQLAARFGRVPAEAKARVMSANEATLTRWSIRVLTAPTLEAVLRGAGGKTSKKAAATARAR